MNRDLTKAQNDYAHFLPALSGFYATYIGKQRFNDPMLIQIEFLTQVWKV